MNRAELAKKLAVAGVAIGIMLYFVACFAFVFVLAQVTQGQP